VTVPFGGQRQIQVPDPQVSKAEPKAKASVAPTSKTSPKTLAKSARKPRGQA
jgi:hypothetical protein